MLVADTPLRRASCARRVQHVASPLTAAQMYGLLLLALLLVWGAACRRRGRHTRAHTTDSGAAARCFDVAALLEKLSLCAENPGDEQRDDVLRSLVARLTDAPTAEVADFFASLMATCHMHVHDARMQRDAFASLYVAVDEDNSFAVIAISGSAFEALTAAMRAHSTDAELQAKCCAMLMVLCACTSHHEDTARALSAGVVDAAVAALGSFSADAEIAQDVLALFAHMSANDDFVACATSAGAAPVLVAVMQKHMQHVDILRGAFKLVCRMAADEPCRLQLLQAGAFTTVLDGLEATCTTPDVARLGIRALEQLLLSNSRVARDVPAAAVSRVVAHAVAVLKDQHDCFEAQVAARDILFLVLFGCDDPEHASFAVRIGAVPVVIAVLQAHPGDVTMQEHGCLMLCKMLTKNVEATEALAADVISAMLTTLRIHATDVRLQDIVLSSLGLTARSSRAASDACANLGAVEAIIAALRNHHGDGQVQCSACVALCWIFLDDASVRRARAVEDVMRLLAMAVRSFLDMSAIHFALRCLAYLARGHPQELERAVRDGVLEACEQARTNGILDEEGAHEQVRQLMTKLRTAAARHDSARCTHSDCVRCAGARSRCELCALPGCGLRRRDGDARKALMRCSTCLAAMYCGPAHQHEDWPRHRKECRAAAATAASATP